MIRPLIAVVAIALASLGATPVSERQHTSTTADGSVRVILNMPGVLLSDDRDKFLREMWDQATQAVQQTDAGEKIDPYPGVDVMPLRAGMPAKMKAFSTWKVSIG